MGWTSPRGGLPLRADKEKGHGAGAGVVADDRPHIIDPDILRTEAAADLPGHEFCVLQAVPVGVSSASHNLSEAF